MENTQNQNPENSESSTPFVPICSWKPLRGNVECKDPVVVSYGNVHYCKRHSTSMQAKLKKVEYNNQIEMEKLKSQLNARSQSEGETQPEEVQNVDSPNQTEEIQTPQNNKSENVLPVSQSTQQTQTPVVENSEITEEPLEEYVEEPRKPRYVIVKKDIYKNEFGYFEDPETNIVFDPARKCAYARIERPSGRLYKLTRKDCKICEQKKWRYVDFYPDETKAKKAKKEEIERSKTKKATKKSIKKKIDDSNENIEDSTLVEEAIEAEELEEEVEDEEVDIEAEDAEAVEELGEEENEEVEDAEAEENLEVDENEVEEEVGEEEDAEAELNEELGEEDDVETTVEEEPEPVKKKVSFKTKTTTTPVVALPVAKATPKIIPKATPKVVETPKVVPKATPKVVETPKVVPKTTPKVVKTKVTTPKKVKTKVVSTPKSDPVKKVATTKTSSKMVRKTK